MLFILPVLCGSTSPVYTSPHVLLWHVCCVQLTPCVFSAYLELTSFIGLLGVFWISTASVLFVGRVKFQLFHPRFAAWSPTAAVRADFHQTDDTSQSKTSSNE